MAREGGSAARCGGSATARGAAGQIVPGADEATEVPVKLIIRGYHLNDDLIDNTPRLRGEKPDYGHDATGCAVKGFETDDC